MTVKQLLIALADTSLPGGELNEDEKAPNYKGLVFTGRKVALNMPLYKYEETK